MSHPSLPQSHAMHGLEPLLITPVKAGLALGFAKQSTRNMLVKNTFPLTVYPIGKSRRKMVKVSELIELVNNLQPEIKRGAPTKAIRLARAAGGTK